MANSKINNKLLINSLTREQLKLDDMVQKLDTFLGSEGCFDKVGFKMFRTMKKQSRVMKEYSKCLGDRIKLLTK